MPTELRKILFPQFIDMDMRHCHLTIFAYVFHVPAAKAILEQGESFWDELLHFSHLKQETKSIIKKAFYALLCGAHPQRQNYQLEKDLAEDFQETYSRPITDHPVVKELLQAVEYVKRQIHEDGGIETPYGWLPYYEQDMKSFLSCVLQRYELAIIAECFRFVKKQKQNHKSTFKIVLFQHDGLSIQVNPGVDPRTVIAQLQKRVWEKGMEFGIPMHFDVKGEIPAFVPTKNPINNNNSTIHPLSSSITTNTNTEIDTPIFPHRESVREMLGGSTRGNLDSQKMRFFRTCMQEFFWSKETYYGCVLKEKRYRFSRKMRHFDGLDPPFG